jgi:hypothetical protein
MMEERAQKMGKTQLRQQRLMVHREEAFVRRINRCSGGNSTHGSTLSKTHT